MTTNDTNTKDDIDNFTAVQQSDSSENTHLRNPQPHEGYALKALKHRENSVAEVMESVAALTDGIEKLDDVQQQQSFLEKLREANLITANEVTDSRSRVSKWNTIRKASDQILDPRVICRLNPGYSVLYELAKLLKELKEDDPVGQLLKLMENLDGPVTRSWLKQQRRLLNPKVDTTAPVDTPTEPSEINKTDTSALDPLVKQATKDQHKPDRVQLAEVRPTNVDEEPVTVLLLTPTPEQVEKLVQLVEEDRKPKRLNVSMASDSTVIATADLKSLMKIAPLLTALGVSFDRMFMSDEFAPTWEMTDAKMVAAFKRGSGVALSKAFVPVADTLPAAATAIDADVRGRKLHLFAEKAMTGWECVIGNDSW